MKRTLAIVLVLVTCAPVLANAQEAGKTAVRRLKIAPAVEPVPAFRYRLLPAHYGREPGNAATLYKTAALILVESRDADLMERIATWRDVPLHELPRREAAQAVSRFRSVLRHVELGAWRERCEWDWPLQEGAAMLLPDLSAYRDIARVLALRARLQVLDGDYDAAVDTLAIGFSFASHLADENLLINDLVAIAIQSILLDAVEDLMQAPDAPSLYWALTALPTPMIDIRPAIEQELSGMILLPEALREPEKVYLNPSGWRDMFNHLARMAGGGSPRDELAPTGLALATYADAKRHLISKGEPAETVEAMPVLQVVAIYLRDDWRKYADEGLKWWYTPYVQARADFDSIERIVLEASKGTGGLLVGMMMPALQRARLSQVQLDRRIAALRVVEALRLHAAASGGRLPQRLEEIGVAPVPLNPATGEPFSYEPEDGRVVLTAPLEPSERPERVLRYEIEMAEDPKGEQR